MELHYKKHHAEHVASLHTALNSVNVKVASVSSLLRTVDYLTPQGEQSVLRLNEPAEKRETVGKLPQHVKLAILENGGGHMNHTLYWRYMAPPGRGPEEPQGKLAQAIEDTFGGLKAFKTAFTEAAMNCLGSGWAWLAYGTDGRLFISTTANQDNPLMKGIVPDAEYGRPILCLDLWEHAYYLKYQNRRADYIAAWWNVVNWPRVERSHAIVTTTSA